MIVSYEVARFLYQKFGNLYKKETVHVYVGTELTYSLLANNTKDKSGVIPAPMVSDVIELLWGLGIQIYYLPESDCCRGFFRIGKETYRLRVLCNSPEDVYEQCLEYLCQELKVGSQ